MKFLSAAVFFLFLALPSAWAAMVPIGVPVKTLVAGDEWFVGGGYSLGVNSIDAASSPRQVWVSFYKDGGKFDDKVMEAGSDFNYGGFFGTRADSIFAGATNDMAQFRSTYIDSAAIGSEQAPSMVDLHSNSASGKKTLTVGEEWQISGGYSIMALSIDARTTPRQVWFVLSKGCLKLDDLIVSQGKTYYYTTADGNVLSTYVDSIFAGATSDMVQLRFTKITLDSDVRSPASFKTPKWNCTEWSACSGDQQTRVCTDSSGCMQQSGKPTESQQCTCTESWSCGSWGACSNGTQARECTDANSCGTTVERPALTQGCSVQQACKENWACGTWSNCSNGLQARTCADAGNCSTDVNKPTLQRPCSSAPCSPNWACAGWGVCSGNAQKRTCTDLNSCGVDVNRPALQKNCISNPCDENWVCGAWGQCIDGNRTRGCTDAAACGATLEKPALTEACSATQCSSLWVCGPWKKCDSGIQERECIDENACGTGDGRPQASRACGQARALQAKVGQSDVLIIGDQNLGIIKIANDLVETSLEMSIESGKFFVKTAGGSREIKAEPRSDSVVALALERINGVEIVDVGGTAFYRISGEKKARLLFILPITMEIKALASVETGEIISVEMPWWGFLTL